VPNNPILSIRDVLLVRQLISDNNEFTCHHPGPLMVTVAGNGSSYYVLIYTINKERVLRAFIGVGFICGDVYHATPKPATQSVLLVKYQPWYLQFRNYRDNARFVRCVALVRAHQVSGLQVCQLIQIHTFIHLYL
jgi:hypothetical protein